jgi:dihydrodipicolinate synthase/N-acetylneuraminate lyase
VSGLSNVWAEFHVELYRAAREGNWEGVRRNHALVHRLYDIHRVTGGKVIPAIKAGAAFFGRCTRRMKIESLTSTEEEAGNVRRVLEGLHLL